MAGFQEGARDSNSPVSATYGGAALQVDLGCGPGFVNATVPAGGGGRGKSDAGGMVEPKLAGAVLGFGMALAAVCFGSI